MTITLYTEDYFDSSHHLTDYIGKCSNSHGHTWKVCVWVRGEESDKDKSGILWDFGNLKKIINYLDHKNLNDILDESPSVENISKLVYSRLKSEHNHLEFRVRIYEKIISKESYCEIGDF